MTTTTALKAVLEAAYEAGRRSARTRGDRRGRCRVTLATPTRREQDEPHPSEAASGPTAADYDSSQPVLSLSSDGDSTQRWYVPSPAGLLVVEVAT